MMNGSAAYYVRGTFTTKVNFPDGDIACIYCPYHKYKTVRGQTRHICVKTYEPLEAPEYGVGADCVLEFKEVPNGQAGAGGT